MNFPIINRYLFTFSRKAVILYAEKNMGRDVIMDFLKSAKSVALVLAIFALLFVLFGCESRDEFKNMPTEPIEKGFIYQPDGGEAPSHFLAYQLDKNVFYYGNVEAKFYYGWLDDGLMRQDEIQHAEICCYNEKEPTNTFCLRSMETFHSPTYRCEFQETYPDGMRKINYDYCRNLDVYVDVFSGEEGRIVFFLEGTTPQMDLTKVLAFQSLYYKRVKNYVILSATNFDPDAPEDIDVLPEYSYRYANRTEKTIEITGFADENKTVTGTLTLPDHIMGHVVESIGEGAFAHGGFSTVVLPSKLKTIGKEAFLDCASLTSVVWNEELKVIGEKAFFGCPLTGEVTIGKELNSIGVGAFGSASSTFAFDNANSSFVCENGALYDKHKTKLIKYAGTAETLTLPDTVETVGSYAFYGNKTLRIVTMPGVKHVGEYAFAKSGIESVFGGKIEDIGNYAFSQSGLKVFTLPNSLDRPGEYAFEETTWLSNQYENGFFIWNGYLIQYVDVPGVTEVTVPSNVRRISTKAFKGSAITALHIPTNVRYIESNIFEECENIRKVRFYGQVTPSVEGLLTDGSRMGAKDIKIYVPYIHHSLWETNLFYLNSENGPFRYVCSVAYRDISNIEYYTTQEFTDEDLPFALSTVSPNPDLDFVGWSSDRDSFNKVTTIDSAAGDVDVYAFYQYPITFDFDKEGAQNIIERVIYRDTFDFPEVPTDDSYYVYGWSNETTGGSYPISLESAIFDCDPTSPDGWLLKALWASKAYTAWQDEGGNWHFDVAP